MADKDNPYDDPYYGYFDPYYGFVGEPYYSYRNGFKGPYNYLPPAERFPSWAREPGPYTGYGPRGYQRTDPRIEAEVSDRLWEDSQVDAGDVSLSVENGIVTLEGSVDSRWAKRKVEDIGWSVPGVTDVVNNLQVNPAPREGQPGAARRWRSQIRPGMTVAGSDNGFVGYVQDIHDSSFRIDRPEEYDVNVPYQAIAAVNGTEVTLNVPADRVGDAYGYRSAPYYARGEGRTAQYAGRGPHSFQRTDDDILDELNGRLWQDGSLDASEIHVTVTGGLVMLTGQVDSRGAKRKAEDVAWSVAGVRDVINSLSARKRESALI